MGSAFYTIDKAANLIKRTRRTVFNYINRGILRREVQDGIIGVNGLDLEHLANELANGSPAFNRQNFLEMNTRIRRLEESIVLLREIAGLRGEPLRPNSDAAANLYHAANAALSSGEWAIEDIEEWVILFKRIDETTLSIISGVIADQQPWTPFFNLCSAMQDFIMKLNSTRANPLFDKLSYKLDECRKSLRQIAIIWIESGRGAVDNVIIQATKTDKDAVLARVARRTEKGDKSSA